jgi:hypothetical protein
MTTALSVMSVLGHSRHHAIPARPLRLKSGHQTRGQSRLVAFESVEEQPRTTAGRHPGWRGAPVATTMASSVRCSRSISPSSSAIFRSRWASGNGVFAKSPSQTPLLPRQFAFPNI